MAILTGPAVEGAIQRGVAKFQYDFTVHGGTVGSINLTGDQLPIGAVVYGGIIDVITALGSAGGATGALNVEAANDLVSATVVAGAPWSTTGLKAIIPVATAGSSVKLTAARNIVLTVAVADLNAGKFNLFLVYFRSATT